jgi:hypothetical protein
VVDTNDGTSFELEIEKPTAAYPLHTKIKLAETKNDVLVNTGVLQCDIPKHGRQLIRYLKMDDKEISTGKVGCSQNALPGIWRPTFREEFGNIERSRLSKADRSGSGEDRRQACIGIRHLVGCRSLSGCILRGTTIHPYSILSSMTAISRETYPRFGIGSMFPNEQLYNRHIRFQGITAGWLNRSHSMEGPA